ncbi:porin [Aquabacterium sp. OR-4]|uniref:porin n=1 Tax=Aquabacterium sp. OR-4 TaxID=2978127 RepID=UPI0021B3784C|nr:porin [Aquabacterium sp. OR-4]MDT7837229.1 porin [Aquabacterium sp. OR-4]
MKKFVPHTIALAVLATAAASASAQSTLTVFGVMDLSANQVKNGSTTTRSMDTAGLNTSRLGFRGTEDLGGGLLAGFWLEAGVSGDTGAAGGGTGYNSSGTTNTGFFNRRSTLSLSGGFGEVRLGRDYTVNFNVSGKFDAFGANGFGNGSNLYANKSPFDKVSTATTTGAATALRVNNAVSYFLPKNLGGLYGQLQIAAPEGVQGNGYKGGLLGYAAGPVDVATSFSQIDVYAAEKLKTFNAGVSYNFGVAKVYGLYNQSKFGALKYTTYELSTGVPLGQGEFRASLGKGNAEGGSSAFNNSDATLWGLEYLYNLSKRTAVYAQTGSLKNKGDSAMTVGGQGSAVAAKSTGFGVGMRHTF